MASQLRALFVQMWANTFIGGAFSIVPARTTMRLGGDFAMAVDVAAAVAAEVAMQDAAAVGCCRVALERPLHEVKVLARE